MNSVRDGVVARFLLEKHFVPTKALVKPRAFLPDLYNGEYTTSIIAADGLSDDDVWAIGREHVAAPREKRLYGHASLVVRDVLATGLVIRKAPEPPPGHREMVGWPAAKEDQISIAQELTKNATLKLIPLGA